MTCCLCVPNWKVRIIAELKRHHDDSNFLFNGIPPKVVPILQSITSASATVFGSSTPYVCDLSQHLMDFTFLITQSQQQSTSCTHQANTGSSEILLATARLFAISIGLDSFKAFNGIQCVLSSFQETKRFQPLVVSL